MLTLIKYDLYPGDMVCQIGCNHFLKLLVGHIILELTNNFLRVLLHAVVLKAFQSRNFFLHQNI